MSLADATSGRVHARAPGKINVFFEVGEVQPDGYHDVASVFQAVSLYEDVWASIDDRFSATVEGADGIDVSGVPLDDTNLAVRAARLIAREIGYEGGIRLHIRKGVPVAGGMGGGSADAAATLVAVNELLDGRLTTLELQEIGAELGADVPFAVLGGTAIGTGRGDELTPALARGRFEWVMCLHSGGLSTPAVYAELDRERAEVAIRPVAVPPAVDPAVLQALRAGDAGDLANVIRNDLQRPACTLVPELDQVMFDGDAHGAWAAFVSGSGPTVVFLAEDADEAEDLAERLSHSGYTALRAHGPVPGARILP